MKPSSIAVSHLKPYRIPEPLEIVAVSVPKKCGRKQEPTGRYARRLGIPQRTVQTWGGRIRFRAMNPVMRKMMLRMMIREARKAA